MKHILVFLGLIISTTSFSQHRSLSHVVQEFVSNYNNEQYNEIYALFSEELQGQLAYEEIQALLQGLKLSVGEILEHEFIATDDSNFSHHKTTFDKAVLDLNILLTEESEISGFTITPFVEEDFSRMVSNELKSNGIISDQQLSLIFELSKGFPNNTELSIGFINDGEIKYFGIQIKDDVVMNIENQEGVFEIGSISKVFTSSILANQVLYNKLDLNEKINKYFDFDFNNNVELSWLQLSNHSSGLSRLPSNLNLDLADPDNPYKEYGPEQLNYYLQHELNLKDSLRSTYQYSNLGAGLLGYALCKKLDTNYESILKSNILDKYELTNTSSVRAKVEHKMVNGLNIKGEQTPNWDMSVLEGAGGILSSVKDLAKFTIEHFNDQNEALQLTSDTTLYVDENMSIGLAWHLIKSDSGKDWLWHNGGTGGYTSSLAFNKKSKNAIIVLSNVSAFNPKMIYIDEICFKLLDSIDK